MQQIDINAMWDMFFHHLDADGLREFGESLDILEGEMFVSWARQRYKGDVLVAFEAAYDTLPFEMLPREN